ncbi:Calx-beta domain-containing protein [uncultured Jannaschia sp.]|uniref:calcium-binding protein n=1 Tax=uncultured Jannaschia sp. TaxID=293347 RepID=UPI00261BED2B|nr:Calx-beta domain-containing protein [uncultured Jannaschia sp.]
MSDLIVQRSSTTRNLFGSVVLELDGTSSNSASITARAFPEEVTGGDLYDGVEVVTFAPGQNRAEISIRGYEGEDAPVIISYSNPEGVRLPTGVEVLRQVHWITESYRYYNSDSIAVFVSDYREKDRDFGGEINVSLSYPQTEEVVVEYNVTYDTASRNDITIQESGFITFLPGQTDLAIPFEIIGDQRDESTEKFFVSIGLPDGLTSNSENMVFTEVYISDDDGGSGGGSGGLRPTRGNDELVGGRGADQIRGLQGNDQISGRKGNDELQGNGGRDRLKGNAGNDSLDGGKGDDILLGQSGNDDLIGWRGNDKLIGGKGDDVITDQAGRNVLKGGSGDDFVSGGTDRDILWGGSGQDEFFFLDSFGRDDVRDFRPVDTLAFHSDLWRGDLNARQVVRRFGDERNDDFVFRFGDGEELVIKDFGSVNGLISSIEIIDL